MATNYSRRTMLQIIGSLLVIGILNLLQVNAAVAAGTLRTVTASVATVPVSIAAVAGAPVSIATVSMAPVQIPPPVVTMAQQTLAVEGMFMI
jgi:hypothetical protein